MYKCENNDDCPIPQSVSFFHPNKMRNHPCIFLRAALMHSHRVATTSTGYFERGILQAVISTIYNLQIYYMLQSTQSLRNTEQKPQEWAVPSTLELVPWGGGGKTLDASPFLFPPPCPAHTTPSSSDCSCTTLHCAHSEHQRICRIVVLAL